MVRPGFTLRTFQPSSEGIKKALGELEAEVMECLWKLSSHVYRQTGASVQEVCETLNQKREIAYTTVMTTMDRLYKKGYLGREKVGKAYIYTTVYTREKFQEALAKEVLEGVLDNFAEPVISTFVDLISEENPEYLDRLAMMIEEKKKELIKKEG